MIFSFFSFFVRLSSPDLSNVPGRESSLVSSCAEYARRAAATAINKFRFQISQQ